MTRQTRRIARFSSAGFVVAGLVLGTLGAAPPEPPVERRAGGYFILAADFHVHGFPGDGALAPWALRDKARRAGLDAFTLTNHNQTFAARLATAAGGEDPGPIVVPGEEITNPAYHLIAAGITHTVDAVQAPADAIRDVHTQGGVAIAAHPNRTYWPGWDDEAIALLDGVERAHGQIVASPEVAPEYEAFYERVRRRNPGVAAIGSSDYHVAGTPGWCRTYVLATERSAAAVVEAVRAGRTVAADPNGVLYGEPRWVDFVESAGGHVPPPPSRDRWTRESAVAAWLGLLGLMLLGTREAR